MAPTNPWILPIAFLLGALLLGYLFRRVLLSRVEAALHGTPTDIDDVLLTAVRRYVPLWFLLGGVQLAARVAPVSDTVADLAGRVAAAAFVVSLALAGGAIASGLLRSWTVRSGANAETTGLLQFVLRATIGALGALLVLSNLGFSVTPLLTALGVGSLAVALALQPTLSNLFAGIHLSIARPIRVGDYIELETGTKGFVVKIGWRATWIRELANNVIVVPNGRLADMVVTNFDMPEGEQGALVQMGVAYGSDLAAVERTTIEVAREVLTQVEGGVAGFDPFIRFHTFGNSSIDFTVILRVKTFTDRYLVTHEFVKRVKARFDREGIEIPFPQRVVHMATPPVYPVGPPASST
jgi:small-conductance mechanosensitive channel